MSCTKMSKLEKYISTFVGDRKMTHIFYINKLFKDVNFNKLI